MQSKNGTFPIDFRKKVIITVLLITASAICASGIFFSIYSFINNISIQVMNTKVSGILFGMAVLYLGIRYFTSLMSLKNELYKPTSRFSWDNFKRKRK